MLANEIKYELDFDLGKFLGRGIHKKTHVDGIFTAQEIIDWDERRDGFSEFFPAGDHEGVSLVFREKSSVDAMELIELDCLFGGFGSSTNSVCMEIHHVMTKHKLPVTTLDYSDFEATENVVVTGQSMSEARRKAAFRIHECFPEQCQDSIEGLEPDAQLAELIRIMETPKFTITEARFANEVGMVVSLSSKF